MVDRAGRVDVVVSRTAMKKQDKKRGETIMSAMQRLLVDLADVLALRFQCACGTAVSITPPNLHGGFDKCPNCGNTWQGRGTELHGLMTLLNEVHGNKENTSASARPYRVQFEIERP
jgi:Zn-finger nucleic acid-binding protein